MAGEVVETTGAKMASGEGKEAEIAKAIRQRDLEWLDAVMPGNRNSLMGQAYRTPEAYAQFAKAKRELDAAVLEELTMLRIRLKSKRREVAELRSRINELLVEGDNLHSQITAAQSERDEARREVERLRARLNELEGR
jgi:chromosome segregation ATPase